ncbi:MAG TPA: hypothetical protein VHM19_20990, partial [Polyangiales bacterium]|nr:hypothetical protein [Polyangiales bacterium]
MNLVRCAASFALLIAAACSDDSHVLATDEPAPDAGSKSEPRGHGTSGASAPPARDSGAAGSGASGSGGSSSSTTSSTAEPEHPLPGELPRI